MSVRINKTMKKSIFHAFIKGILDFTHICWNIYENKKRKRYLNNFTIGYLIKNPGKDLESLWNWKLGERRVYFMLRESGTYTCL